MGLPAPIIDSLSAMPLALERILRLVPEDKLDWQPASWEGIPGEQFSALGQACHVRDIEIDGYHVRIRRMLEEVDPDLVSIDSYDLARERRYGEADLAQAIATFRVARAQTLGLLSDVTAAQLARGGTFAEYGRITLAGLVHYLCSHDQQHLACLQWLLGRMRSRA